ncbi:isochorismatase family protein [Microbacterium rhizomatis]|uniref:Isochorismatase family protein n=1 Tax=Microbacterium rhizomatis TaxID=1631477 RepID=A0A5J5J9A1_9MICO|nr:isochorismatase family protein [Microbacterium rhizomatis]KAA9111373.1 isochorismatase family protein [Microbacterium rhizomatis]
MTITTIVPRTARAAHEHGHHVTIAVDAVADFDPEAHANSIQHIVPAIGETGTTGEIVRMLESPER